ncbi:hypothetical protein BJX70DRAFT_362249 [Aspergillus crustosus]
MMALRTQRRKAQASTRPTSSTKSEKKIPKPHSKNNKKQKQADDYTTDEEEVIYDLDRTALSKLPTRLQNNMREIQAERIQRLRKEQRRYLYRRDENPHQPRGEEYDRYYAERWFSRAIVELDEARKVEDEIKRKMEEYERGFGRPQNMTWCPVQRVWVPVSYEGRRRVIDRAAGSGVVRMKDIRGYGRSRRVRMEIDVEAGEETGRNRAVGRCDCKRSSYERYMSWRCAWPYYEYEAGPGGNGYPQEQPSGIHNGFSFRAAVRHSIRAKVQRVREIFRR